jgi:large repetitive protein
VSNLGPDDATGVTVIDPLPAKLGSPVATTSAGSCSIVGLSLTCDVGALASGARATIQVTGTLAAGTAGTFLRNTASVSGDQPDPDLSNNHDSVRALILATRLTLKKTADHPTVQAGATIGFTLTLHVPGPVAAVNVVVCDALPAHMTFSSAPGATFSGGKACWTFAHVASGATRTMRVIAKVDADAPTGDERNVARAASTNAGTARADAAVHVLARSGDVPPVTG